MCLLPGFLNYSLDDNNQSKTDINQFILRIQLSDLQNITHKTKDRVTRTPLKTESELRCYIRQEITSKIKTAH